MKMAYFIGSLNRGGAEMLLLDIVNNHADQKNNVIVIFRKKGLLYEDFLNSGVGLHELRPKFKFDIHYLLTLRRVIKKAKLDLIHAHQTIDAFYAILASKGLSIKIVFTLHGYDYKFIKLARRILRFVFKRTTHNIFVSESQRSYFINKYKLNRAKTSVIYNGISLNKFENLEHSPIRNEFNVNKDQLLLGSVGNFNPARDQMTICRFLHLLDQENIDFAFVFAGAKAPATPWHWDNCVKYCLDKNLQEKVFFPGSRSDIPEFIKQLDAFIYSTDHDTFGIAVVEAIISSTPVFINDREAMLEITEEGKHANIYRTKEENDLFQKFMDFYHDREKYTSKAIADAAWAKNKYSITTHMDKLSETYQQVLGSGLHESDK